MVTIVVAFFVAQALFGGFVTVLIRAERKRRLASASGPSSEFRQDNLGSVVGPWAKLWLDPLRSTLASVRLVSQERCQPYPLPTRYANLRRLHERRGRPRAAPATIAWRKAA
jgi:hypothetical protein